MKTCIILEEMLCFFLLSLRTFVGSSIETAFVESAQISYFSYDFLGTVNVPMINKVAIQKFFL